jgi:very-short-patch-repair endonuclease
MNKEIGPFTVDALWDDHGLVVELDGGAAHGRPAAVVRDRNRELYLRERGYRVVRYSWLQVFDEPARIAADLWLQLRPLPPAGRSRSPSAGG